jgi:uncharacterized membrane protein YkoI
MMIRNGILFAALLAAGLPAGEAHAQRWRMDLSQQLDAQRGQEELSGEALVRAIRSQIEGKLLDILGRQERGDRAIYLIRWMMPDGEIRTLEVDARTGRIVG